MQPVVDADEKPFLNTARWLSCAAVVYGHVFLLVYPSFTFRENAIGAALVASAKLRSLAVWIFFVVSGYLIGGAILTSRRKFSWRRFSIHRFARIYTPLIPALLLTVTLDNIACYIDPSSAIYTTPWPTHILGMTAPIDNYRIQDIIAGILSLEVFVGLPLGSDAPLWSLGLEWCFYFLFPVIFIVFRIKDNLIWHLSGVTVGAVVLWLFFDSMISPLWLIWCSGALSRRWLGQSGGLTGRQGALALCASALSIVAALMFSETFRPLLSVMFGASFAISLQSNAVIRLSLCKADKLLADMSYSMYITHMPVCVFLIFLATTYEGMPIGGYHNLLQGLPLAGAMLIASFVTAWLFSIAFESRTPMVRSFLESLFTKAKLKPNYST